MIHYLGRTAFEINLFQNKTKFNHKKTYFAVDFMLIKNK
ncbi:hypothetical protein L289_2576 [Acinetobacter gerneri DSM 14967 = CIP 107464 = MTCC 9824]|nr:hypothetical protein L289_2576 [Acinetobacter gerneri DSM 14967 = CIP 107464 = MTCC 9824]